MNFWRARLKLENGMEFVGNGFGSRRTRVGEVVFNTGMSGYQEVLSDPSYYGQIVVMTYPHIGNTGCNRADFESAKVYAEGMVMAEVCEPSSHRSESSLEQFLLEQDCFGLSGIDTRELVSVLRTEGAQKGVLFAEEETRASETLKDAPPMVGQDLVAKVTCLKPWTFCEGDRGRVVVYDFGLKLNILRCLQERKYSVTVVPATFPVRELERLNPVKVVLSNGPGDPDAVEGVIPILQNIVGKYPIFAICMGHQLLGKALGAKLNKMKFGHHGVNHPVQDVITKRVYITSHNHGFAVDGENLKGTVQPRFYSLNDGTLEGFESQKLKIFSMQFHPEAAPGPQEAGTFFSI